MSANVALLSASAVTVTDDEPVSATTAIPRTGPQGERVEGNSIPCCHVRPDHDTDFYACQIPSQSVTIPGLMNNSSNPDLASFDCKDFHSYM